MCGIVGIYSHTPVATELYDSLIHLQHRGQDAAGITTYQNTLHTKRGAGLVQEIFYADTITQLKGNIGIGHTRYPTAGGYNANDVQPLCSDTAALAHNGNLVNYHELAPLITNRQSSIDSEVLLHLLQPPATTVDFFTALCASVKNIMNIVQGSYSVVSIIQNKGLVAFRDPHGIRPLVIGERITDTGKKDYIIASETTMFYSLGFQLLGDIEHGELVYIDEHGKLFRHTIVQKQFSPCIFEYVYFARPDSIINKIGVYRSRLHMGQNLARHWKKLYPDTLPDVVIPAPFTSNTAALAFAHEIGVRYSEGLYKNPFIGRTFIMPDGKKRSRGVRHKLTPQRSEIQDMKVLILDDSLVRGTTSAEIVKMVKEYGAKEIYFVLACPPIKNPCFYGIDMPSRQELIAANKSIDEIRDFLGVNKLLYLEIDDLVEAVTRHSDPKIKTPCMACMNGCYVTGNITETKITSLEKQRILDKCGIGVPL